MDDKCETHGGTDTNIWWKVNTRK